VGGIYANPHVRRLEVKEFALESRTVRPRGFRHRHPPEPDDPWTRGKGGYKALLYMAVGIPVVASRVGVNTDIGSDAETGFCVSTTEEWIVALRRLVADPTLRERMGAAGRARVMERYSIQVIAPRLAEALTTAARAAS
jgi:glycosyltransferase involved in cell wall biosynthesis